MNNENIRKIIDQCMTEIPCAVDVRYNEPMSLHTTFKIGGPADCWLRPEGDNFPAFCAYFLSSARKAGIPVFILGGGANIVVSDLGIRGFALDVSAWKGKAGHNVDEVLSLRSGTSMDEAAETAAAAGLSGLEFLAGMPGSIGGAAWMNARCYGREIADSLIETEIIDFSQDLAVSQRIAADRADFGYKRSPFQGKDYLILSAGFRLKTGNENEIRGKMRENRLDREAKGHYSFPCAGSAFKNNRDFGKSTGEIIDGLGLRGLKFGAAQVAPFHGNIIINTGGACAADVRSLIEDVAAKVKAGTGFILEPEILFIGDW